MWCCTGEWAEVAKTALHERVQDLQRMESTGNLTGAYASLLLGDHVKAL